MNYMANSINLDGVRAEEIKKSLAADIQAEVVHAQQLGNRIKQLGGLVPGSASGRDGETGAASGRYDGCRGGHQRSDRRRA